MNENNNLQANPVDFAHNPFKYLTGRLQSELQAGLWSGLRYWFVEYNPLYFFSAFLVLYGVFLIANNLDSIDFISIETSQLILFGVLQLYEILIVGTAAFLIHRAKAIRPGVMLALLEALFLFDCTFRLEGLSLIGQPASALALSAWLLLTWAKIWGLARAMKIQLGNWQYAAIIVTAVGIVAFILALSYPDNNKLMVVQLATWAGVFYIMVLDVNRPVITTLLARTTTSQIIAHRSIQAWFRILVAGYFYHLWTYIVVSPEIQPSTIFVQFGATMLLGSLVVKRERDVWALGILAFMFNHVVPIQYQIISDGITTYNVLAITAIGMAFAWRAWHGLRGGLPAGAAIAMYAAIWLWSYGSIDLAPPLISWSWQTVLIIELSAILITLGLVLNDGLALTIMAIGIFYGSYRIFLIIIPILHTGYKYLAAAIYTAAQVFLTTLDYIYRPLIPLLQNELTRGMLVLALGFIVFFVAIIINWRLRNDPETEVDLPEER